WAAEKERPPLGFLGPALRLLASHATEDPFLSDARDPRRIEVRILFHLSRRYLRSMEPPRDLLDALVERRRTGVQLSELARRIDPVLAGAFLFAMMPRERAALLADELGKPDELRIFRRIANTDVFEGR